MSIVRDPSTGKGANVNDEGELIVRAINESELEHASILGQAYSWHAPTADIGAGDTMLFIKNLGDTPLILDRMVIIPGNVDTNYNIHLGRLTTPPDAIDVTGINLNPNFADDADVHAVADEDAVADGSLVDVIHVLTATASFLHPLTGIILTKGVYIQINQESESTAGAVTIIGHFENPD